jgi:hypothetical protein
MRVSNLCWGLCTAMLVASAAQAGSDEPFGALDDSPRFMLYVHKEVGAVHHKSAGPSFGFAVDRPIPLTLHRDQSALRASSARILDLRVAPFDGGAIMLNGLKLTGGTQQGLGYSGSYGEGESWDNPWLWFGLALVGAVGISCATDNWPCDDGGYGGGDDYQVPGT